MVLVLTPCIVVLLENFVWSFIAFLLHFFSSWVYILQDLYISVWCSSLFSHMFTYCWCSHTCWTHVHGFVCLLFVFVFFFWGIWRRYGKNIFVPSEPHFPPVTFPVDGVKHFLPIIVHTVDKGIMLCQFFNILLWKITVFTTVFFANQCMQRDCILWMFNVFVQDTLTFGQFPAWRHVV